MNRGLMQGLYPGFSMPPAVSYSRAVLDRNPTGLYMLDEKSGTEVLDSSGNNRHGAYQNGAVPVFPGMVNESSRSLNAVSNQFAKVPGGVVESIAGFSIALWLQFSHTTNLIIAERNQNAGYSLQTFSATTGSAGTIGLVTGGGAPVRWLQSSIAINDGIPHCAVFTFGGTPASSYLYIDGIDRSTRPESGGTPSYGATTVWDVGSRNGTVTLNGRLGGLAFFPYLLPAEDAKILFKAGSA
jgi:hypothetical protein